GGEHSKAVKIAPSVVLVRSQPVTSVSRITEARALPMDSIVLLSPRSASGSAFSKTTRKSAAVRSDLLRSRQIKCLNEASSASVTVVFLNFACARIVGRLG